MKVDISDKDIEILKFNYRNLHESVWNAHNVAWIVTSIFVPILFGALGYLVKEHSVLSTFQVVMAAVATEFLMFIWWLIMRVLEHYNDIRLKRLREIEGVFKKQIVDTIPLFQQYCLGFKQSIKRLRISPMNIYHVIFAGYTIINIVLVCTKA